MIDWLKRKRVINALRAFAEDDGNWFFDSCKGILYLNIGSSRSYSHKEVGFNKDELKEFLKHYDELSNNIVLFKEHPRERR